MRGDISVVCRDCGDLVGGAEAGNRVMWTICGCLYRNATAPWYRKAWRFLNLDLRPFIRRDWL